MPPTSDDSVDSGGPGRSNTITFDTTKNELYRISDNYKTLQVFRI